MFTEEEEVKITIVMEGNTYGRRAKLGRDSTYRQFDDFKKLSVLTQVLYMVCSVAFERCF